MSQINLWAAWAGMAAGVLSGAVIGLGFASEHFLGGYDSWRRRLLRLGHIAFFGIAFINLAFVLTVDVMKWSQPPIACAYALAAANVLMPGICFLSAWKKPFRQLFFIPVLCVLAGIAGVLGWRA